MLPNLSKIKGVHPGLVLQRELAQNNIKGSELAMAIGEYKQTISAIINQKRGVNPELSIKLGAYFDTDDDYFMMLQAGYEVKNQLKERRVKTPNLTNFRKVLFWDTTFDKIDWYTNKRAIIKRVLERGTDTEINEIIAFYGKATVSKVVHSIKQSRFAAFRKNVKDYQLM